MNLKQINKIATYLVMGVLLLLAAGAFRLSFDVLQKEAEKFGVSSELSWIVPIIIDIGILGGSAFVIWASINGQRGLRTLGYVVIGAITALSVVLNRYHATADSPLNITYMIAPPILLATMTVLVERMLEVMIRDVDNTDILQDKLVELHDTVDKLRHELSIEQAMKKQLESNYAQVSHIIHLLPYIRQEVFLLAKVAQGSLSIKQAFEEQNIYKRLDLWEGFASKVTTISGD